MKKISPIIFVSLFFLCLSSTESFALGKSGCKRFDILCQLTGKGATDQTQPVKNTSSKKSNSGKRALNENGCVRGDFICNWTGKGAQTNKKKITKKNKRIKVVSAKPTTEVNVYSGMFDFSDDGQAAGLIGLEHQSEELWRDSAIGKISPITGGFLTANNAFYLYTGVQAEYDLGFVKVIPSFTPGLYGQGDGKDLGYPLEFKSEIQMSFDLSQTSHLGMSYNHISNASLGTKNPGANSYMFNYFKKF